MAISTACSNVTIRSTRTARMKTYGKSSMKTLKALRPTSSSLATASLLENSRREQLVMQGVWVKGPRGSISYAKTLQDCLDETTPAEWTEEAIRERHKLIQSAATDSVARLPQNTSTQPFQQQVQPPLQPPQLSYHLNQPQPPPTQSQQPLGFLPAQQTPRQPYQPYTQFPIPGRGDSGSTQAKLLTDLMKIYNGRRQEVRWRRV